MSPRVPATLTAAATAEAAYLRRVHAAPAHAVALAEQLVSLAAVDPLRFNLAMLEVAEMTPGTVAAALDTALDAGCLACGHDPHVAGDCAMPTPSELGGGLSTWCGCGTPGPAPVVLTGQDLTDALTDAARARERGE